MGSPASRRPGGRARRASAGAAACDREARLKRDRRERRSPAVFVTRRDVAALVAFLTLLDTIAKILFAL